MALRRWIGLYWHLRLRLPPGDGFAVVAEPLTLVVSLRCLWAPDKPLRVYKRRVDVQFDHSPHHHRQPLPAPPTPQTPSHVLAAWTVRQPPRHSLLPGTRPRRSLLQWTLLEWGELHGFAPGRLKLAPHRLVALLLDASADRE